MATWVQVLDNTVCISHSTNTFEKIKNLTILPLAMSKQWGRLGSLALVWQLIEEKENWIQTYEKLTLYNNQLMQRGWVNMYMFLLIYIYIYIRVCTYIYIYIKYIKVCKYICVCMYIYIYVCMHIHVCVCVCMCVCVHTFLCEYIYIYIYIKFVPKIYFIQKEKP